MHFITKTRLAFSTSLLSVLFSVALTSGCSQRDAEALKKQAVDQKQEITINENICALNDPSCKTQPPDIDAEVDAPVIEDTIVDQPESLVGDLHSQFTTKEENKKRIEENVAYLKGQLKEASDEQILKIAKYLSYIKLSPSQAHYKKDVSRLLDSSTQFILCTSLEDLQCLEDAPAIAPRKILRVDTANDLGKPVRAGDKLDIEYYFTKGWYDNHIKKQKPFIIPEVTVAKKLAEKISSPEVKSMSMALYGIDDISDSMSSVYQAVQKRVIEKIPVKAVVDVSDATRPNDLIRDYDLIRQEDGTYKVIHMPGLLDLSYVNPKNPANWAFGAPYWAVQFLKDVEAATQGMSQSKIKEHVSTKMIKFDKSFTGNTKSILADILWIAINKKSNDVESTLTRMAYQYQATQDLLRVINSNSRTDAESMGRIEYPYSGIMHNKFVVFEKNDQSKSVWTGTANISRTCMGSEENANMSVYVKNTLIAQAFQDEFNEMYGPSNNGQLESLITGAFHTKKRPNTKRYFTFDDGTHVRVHFSPTDDAEHRVILPMLYSARKGDIIRISMFGSAGYELVRALQSAAARGVEVRIAVDSLSGAGTGSWIKSTTASLLEPNPYQQAEQIKGLIEVRKNDWKGLNHYKAATLTRKMADGSYHPEVIIIGSQNWSGSGNDLNDENVITISNKTKSLAVMTDYNEEFDSRIWSLSTTILKQ